MGIVGVHRTKALFVFVVTAFVALFGLVEAVQSVYIHGLGLGDVRSGHIAASLAVRVVANGSAVVLTALLAAVSGLETRVIWSGAGMIAGFSAFVAVVRMGIQLVFTIHPAGEPGVYVIDALMTAVVVALGYALGRIAAALQQRVVHHARQYAEERLRSAAALAALQAEELRVRRDVADELHGSLQQSLVMVSAQLRDALADLEQVERTQADGSAQTDDCYQRTVEALRSALERLETIREHDVRQVSHALYPAGLSLGLAQALRSIAARVPDSIAMTVEIEPAVTAADGPSTPEGTGLAQSERLLLVRIFEEALSNALRHGHASAVALSVTLERAVDGGHTFVLCVDDDGSGIADSASQLSGIERLRRRLGGAGGMLAVSNGPLGGVRVQARLAISPTVSPPGVARSERAESALGMSAE